jgi:hypothetical protein
MRELSEEDISNLCKTYHIVINGCYCRDEVNKLKSGWSIINLDLSNGQGTHFTCVFLGNSNLYFDSFSLEAPQQLHNKLGKYYYNNKKIQSIASDSCGWFSLLCVKYCEDRGNTLEAFREFLSMFCADKPDSNEKILENKWQTMRG